MNHSDLSMGSELGHPTELLETPHFHLSNWRDILLEATKKAQEDLLAAAADEKHSAKENEEETLKRKWSEDDDASAGE